MDAWIIGAHHAGQHCLDLDPWSASNFQAFHVQSTQSSPTSISRNFI
jgi:hypothetical protein